jgi:hypothetical protein
MGNVSSVHGGAQVISPSHRFFQSATIAAAKAA